jgi:SAM-dependent methyltransferase
VCTTTGDLLEGRVVSTGSVFSTILISTVIHSAAPSGRVGRLVDVGSGDSPYRDVIPHDSYVGVDRRPIGADALLVTADAAGLPLRDGVADAVLCTEVIEHVPDEHELAGELARIAAPGAALVLSAPFVHGLHEQPYDYRRLTSIGLIATLERAGWQVCTVSAIGGPVVVALDGLVRWADSTWRRAVRRVAPKGSRPFELLTAPSAWTQRALAAAALRRGRNLGPIDPLAPNPRLTLGYVVFAVRRVAGPQVEPHGEHCASS